MTASLRVSRLWAGLLSGLAGIAVAHAATAIVGARANPVVAVAEVVIAVTPGGPAEFLIALVGQYDKPILVTGVVLVVLALAAWTGVLAGRGHHGATLTVVALGVIGVVAAVTRPEAEALDAVPAILGAVTWLVVLPILSRAATASTEPGQDAAVPAGGSPIPFDRRRFLVTAAVVGLGSLAAGTVGQLLGASRRSVEAARSLLRLPVTRGHAPAGADLRLPGMGPWRTPTEDFYRIDTALVVPSIDPVAWSLRIHGLVEQELVLTYQDLLDRELTEAWVTLCCVSNEIGGDLIGNAWWSGVRVADVLAEAGLSAGADAVLQTSQDGWTCGTPLAALTDDRAALLAVAMNGLPLPLEHGFPVRMVVPGLYGYVSATKWLVDLEVTRFADIEAYWTSRGWSERGPVKTQSRIDVPRNDATVPAGVVRVGGSAWAQHVGIEQVEYRIDGRPWQAATLGHVPSEDTWVQWQGTVEATPGEHTLAVRATDRAGATQTAVRTGVVPDGATGWHTITFTAE